MPMFFASIAEILERIHILRRGRGGFGGRAGLVLDEGSLDVKGFGRVVAAYSAEGEGQFVADLAVVYLLKQDIRLRQLLAVDAIIMSYCCACVLARELEEDISLMISVPAGSPLI